MKTLVIIRGTPGSGKTTLAHALIEQAYDRGDLVEHCEADQFFTDHDGKYHYIPHLVPKAHEWCQRKVLKAMIERTPTIIVSNTSTVRSRIQPYLDLAKEYGYEVQQVVTFASFGSVHGVPKETVEKFRDQLGCSLIRELEEHQL